VGFDISYAYELARDLNVRLEFIPFSWPKLDADLIARRFDIAMSGIYVTEARLSTATASNFYYRSPVALLVPSARAERFLSRAAIEAMGQLRLAVAEDATLLPLARRLFPRAQIHVVRDYGELPALGGQVDAALWTLQQASAWAIGHPGFTAVEPAGLGGPLLFAYLMPPGSDAFRDFLDQWLAYHAASGFRAAQLAYWLEGRPRADDNRPRWSLFDALLNPTR
jgi:ABC-type amino acid transport substrate-binding protein